MQHKLVVTGLVVVSGILLFLAGCKSDSANPYSSTSAPPPPVSQPNTVLMVNMGFSPGTITVPKNTTINWQNNDGVVHTATSNNATWDTGDIQPGTSKAITFATVGTFPFHCTHHAMMTGTVIVQ